MAEDSASAAGGATWALVTVLLVVVVLAVLYFGGFMEKSEKKSIDININKPGIALPIGRSSLRI